MKDLYLVARIADTDVAISCSEVESVVSVGEIIPVPAAPNQVAGLFALRSRVITLIDKGHAFFGGRAVRPGDTAIVSQIGGHVYGFVVQSLDDVTVIEKERIMEVGGIAKGWRDMAIGVATMDDRALMLISLEKFIATSSKMAA